MNFKYAALGACLGTAVAAGLSNTEWIQRADRLIDYGIATTWASQLPSKSQVTIVSLDLGVPEYSANSLSRDSWVQLVELIVNAKPAALGLDVVFSGPTQSTSDARLSNI